MSVRNVLSVDSIESASKFLMELTHSKLLERKEIYRNLAKSYGIDILRNDMTKALYELNKSIYSNYRFHNENETEFAAYFLAVSGASLSLWWLFEKPELSKEEFTQLFLDWGFAHFRELGLV